LPDGAASEDAAKRTSAQQQGGCFSDQNNAYVYAYTSRQFGNALVLTGRIPTVAHTSTAAFEKRGCGGR